MAVLFTQSVAIKIVDVVSRDLACRRVIEDSKYRGRGRWAGWSRNKVIVPDNYKGDLSDPNDPMVQFLCVGISKWVVARINSDRFRHPIPGVLGCQPQSTALGEHTAVEILMKDRNNVVMDWWQNLNIRNPVIYTTRALFVNSLYMFTGTDFKDFKG